MYKGIRDLFSSELGEKIYRAALSTIDKYGMREMIESGVLVGLSGGADSVMLLLLLIEYRCRENKSFPIVAVHVNHMIRGDEADRDERFSEDLAKACGIEFCSLKIDVPSLAKDMNIGTEEAARNARYSAFAEIISGRNDISTIATAHNATDNAETVIFNLARGAGSRGTAGIAPVRGNVVRPLISVSKSEIADALNFASVKYVIDSTNYSTEYSRNYIRHEILPHLSRINERYISAVTSHSDSVREDVDFIEGESTRFLSESGGENISRVALLGLHPAVLSRVLMQMARSAGISSLERVHITDIRRLLSGDNFKYSTPGGYVFSCERGVCRFLKEIDEFTVHYRQELAFGNNKLIGYDSVITLGKCEEVSSNVYKFSIHADLSSAIIFGSLYVRFRLDGDSYRYGGMTHKLKKVFNDKDVPPSIRGSIPIICDDKGIVWVPGLGVRDDGVKNTSMPITFSVLADSSDRPTYAVGRTK